MTVTTAMSRTDDPPLYALVWRDVGYWLVGPFADFDALSEWCIDPKNNPTGDPRWGTVRLANPYTPAIVLTPDGGPL